MQALPATKTGSTDASCMPALPLELAACAPAALRASPRPTLHPSCSAVRNVKQLATLMMGTRLLGNGAPLVAQRTVGWRAQAAVQAGTVAPQQCAAGVQWIAPPTLDHPSPTLPAVLLCLLVFVASSGAVAENVTLCWGEAGAEGGRMHADICACRPQRGHLPSSQEGRWRLRPMPTAGDASYGQLGDGQGNGDFGSLSSNVPVEVAGGRSFAAGCTGQFHSCALEPSGQAWCWGRGSAGQLGAGSNAVKEISLTPVAVSGNHVFRSITCGAWHTCALDDQGRAWCWGRYCRFGKRFLRALQPAARSGIACTFHSSPCLDTAGSNAQGKLGTGDEMDSTEPTPAAAGHIFTALSAGTSHTCGLEASGSALCWGVWGEGSSCKLCNS